MKNKILIVEDEVLISEHLKRIILNLGYQALEICEDYKETIEILKTETPDLAFLDIRMNGIDEGIEIAKHLRILGIPFIFITSFSDKDTLKNAINQQPLGYVLKPFSKEDIQEQLELIEKEISDTFLTIGNTSNKERLPIKNILWLRSENVYVEIHCINKVHVHRGKLKEIQKTLPSRLFARTGQSHLVNLSHINSTTIDSVIIGKDEIPLSKKYRTEFFEKFSNL
jgi:DNA-binding LytR/AlgR family response regulator